MRFLYIFMLCFLFASLPVQAESEPEVAPPVQGKVELSEKSQKTAQKIEDSLERLKEKVADVNDGLEPHQSRHFMTIYNNHNLLSTIEIVRGDIKAAVQACGEENKDMPELNAQLDERFQSWDTAVGEALDEGRAQLKNMITAQNYTKRNTIRNVLKRADRVRGATNKTIEKVPVATPAACSYLLGKMDKTQEVLSKLIRSTLVSLPEALEAEPYNKGEAPKDEGSAE